MARSAAAPAGQRDGALACRARPAGAVGHRGPLPRLPGPGGWVGLRLALANPRLACGHPITDSNVPGPSSARFASGRGSAVVGNLFLRVRVCVGGVVN
jgi:hypothetical protein